MDASPVVGSVENSAADPASYTYVGRWNRLVSTTNWEKGRIIHDWRAALAENGRPTAEYADEAWSRLVGSVTPQHTGRLRRVYARFGESHASYEGLYWSHFQAALDWDDAEMWLEGALQNNWTVSQMRFKRWETLGAVAADTPQPTEIVAAEPDEDCDPDVDRPLSAGPAQSSDSIMSASRTSDVTSTMDEGYADEDTDGEGVTEDALSSEVAPAPFADLPRLPDDVLEAVEGFKLVIVRHRMDGWRDVSPEALLTTLNALRQFVMTPSA